ncbi:MAG: hypothetical protein IE909_11340 [Campylobacterales bacterium]|nr:hypothetical protein [Campylobacterales bacterium]
MQFDIGDFRVFTSKEIEQLNEQVAMPTSLKNGKPSEYVWQYKTREITVFSGLNLLEKEDGKYYRVINDIFVFIDLIEIFKAFIGNKLDTSKTYQIGDSFTAKTAQKDGNMSLSIHFKNYSYKLYLDKFECSSLAAKFSKILQRCEAWQESEA